jgi:hypothetical protein
MYDKLRNELELIARLTLESDKSEITAGIARMFSTCVNMLEQTRANVEYKPDRTRHKMLLKNLNAINQAWQDTAKEFDFLDSYGWSEHQGYILTEEECQLLGIEKLDPFKLLNLN